MVLNDTQLMANVRIYGNLRICIFLAGVSLTILLSEGLCPGSLHSVLQYLRNDVVNI